jgi:hypothetical protein
MVSPEFVGLGQAKRTVDCDKEVRWASHVKETGAMSQQGSEDTILISSHGSQ